MIVPIIGDRKKYLHISTHDAMHAINLKKCLKCASDTVELPIMFYNNYDSELSRRNFGQKIASIFFSKQKQA